MTRRILASFLMGWAASCGLAAFSGCGSESAPFVPKAEYTPESLAQELAFRYDRMNPVSKPRPVLSPKNREPEGSAEKVQSKSKAKTKAERAATLEDLVDETVAKSREVPGSKPEDVLRKVAEIIEKDEKIKPSDRRLMADRLARSK